MMRVPFDEYAQTGFGWPTAAAIGRTLCCCATMRWFVNDASVTRRLRDVWERSAHSIPASLCRGCHRARRLATRDQAAQALRDATPESRRSLTPLPSQVCFHRALSEERLRAPFGARSRPLAVPPSAGTLIYGVRRRSVIEPSTIAPTMNAPTMSSFTPT